MRSRRTFRSLRVANVYTFDWRALQRWGLKESDLPPGSVVLNRQPTVWELYWRYIVGGIVLLLFQTLLIFGLVRQRARRRTDRNDAERDLRPAPSWQWKLGNVSDGTGTSRPDATVGSAICRPFSESNQTAIPDAWRTFTAWYTRKIEHSSGKRLRMPGEAGNPTQQNSGCLRPDGTCAGCTGRGEFYYDANGDAERMLGMAVDITERKLAEEALKKSEEKFSKAFRESPMALAVTRVKDHRYIDVNDTYEQMTGWRRDEIIGRTPFDLKLWVDPTQRTEMAKEIQAKGTVRNLEFRFRRKDGEQRDGLGSAELIEIEGEPCLMAVVADITERKQIRAAASRE